MREESTKQIINALYEVRELIFWAEDCGAKPPVSTSDIDALINRAEAA